MINMLMMNTVLIDRIFTQSADDELVLMNHFFFGNANTCLAPVHQLEQMNQPISISTEGQKV